MAVAIRRELAVDRIRYTVEIPDLNLFKHALGQLSGMLDHRSDFIPEGKITLLLSGWNTRLGYYPTKGKRKIADIIVGTTKSKRKYLSLDLYPSKFRPGEFERFQEMLLVLLDDSSYQRMFYTARVNYVEFAADSLSAPMHSFIALRPRSGRSQYFPLPGGEKGTLYLGASASSLRFRIYNKKKQLVETGEKAPHQVQTRVEAIIRNTGLAGSNLALLPNPFPGLLIAEKAKIGLYTEDPAWESFLVACDDLGAPAALALLSTYTRQKYRLRLMAAAAWWWNPQEIWQDLPLALSVIAPLGESIKLTNP